jgi:hypothetical protein
MDLSPQYDGQVKTYNPTGSTHYNPRIYFVNGIRVLPQDHALTALYLSLLIEHPVHGVYNKTAGVKIGSIIDGLQCVADYLQNSTARLSSGSNLGKPGRIREQDIPNFLMNIERNYTVWNRATLGLFKQLVENRQYKQLIIAHSQGNLITSNALFVLEDVLGAQALSKIRVYSLASPAPAWPVGLSKINGGGGRQDNAFMNDLVALLRPHNLASKLGFSSFQNSGDFRTYGASGPVALEPHAVTNVVESLNFIKSLRMDLGLPGDLDPLYMRKAQEIALSLLSKTDK